MRCTISWPIVIPRTRSSSPIVASGSVDQSVRLAPAASAGPLLQLFLFFWHHGTFGRRPRFGLGWFLSGLKAELLAVTALGFVAVFAIYMIFITMTGPVTYRFSLFHLLTVSPLYTVSFVITIGLSAWSIYSVASGILAARQILNAARSSRVRIILRAALLPQSRPDGTAACRPSSSFCQIGPSSNGSLSEDRRAAAGPFFCVRSATSRLAEPKRTLFGRLAGSVAGFEGQALGRHTATVQFLLRSAPFEIFASFVRSTNRSMPAIVRQFCQTRTLRISMPFFNQSPETPNYRNIPLLNR